MAEYAALEHADIESIICLCGNHTADEGMPQANSDGIVSSLDSGPAPEGLSELPAEGETFTLCRACGRLYRDADAEENRIPVYKTVDVRSGAVAKSLEVHDSLN